MACRLHGVAGSEGQQCEKACFILQLHLPCFHPYFWEENSDFQGSLLIIFQISSLLHTSGLCPPTTEPFLVVLAHGPLPVLHCSGTYRPNCTFDHFVFLLSCDYAVYALGVSDFTVCGKGPRGHPHSHHCFVIHNNTWVVYSTPRYIRDYI